MNYAAIVCLASNAFSVYEEPKIGILLNANKDYLESSKCSIGEFKSENSRNVNSYYTDQGFVYKLEIESLGVEKIEINSEDTEQVENPVAEQDNTVHKVCKSDIVPVRKGVWRFIVRCI